MSEELSTITETQALPAHLTTQERQIVQVEEPAFDPLAAAGLPLQAKIEDETVRIKVDTTKLHIRFVDQMPGESTTILIERKQ